MLSDLAADRLLATARGTADPLTAARAVMEAFLTMSRTAEPAALVPMVEHLAALRRDPAEPQTEILHHTLAGVVGVRTGQPYATRHLDTALRIFAEHGLHTDGLYLECAMMSTLTLIRPQDVRPGYAHLVDRLGLDPARRARLAGMIGLGDAWAGDLSLGRAGLLDARRLADEADRPDLQAEITSWLAKVEALRGDLAASAAHLAEARILAARAGSGWVAAHIAECAAALHLVSGDTESWTGVLEFLVGTRVGANSGLMFEHRWELATHHALRGDQQSARALLAGVPDPPLEWPGAPAMPAWRGWIAEPTDPYAMELLETALAGLNRPVERLSRARLAWLLGAQHARLGRRADATRLFELACTGYAAIGAAGPLARVVAELRGLGGHGTATGDGPGVRISPARRAATAAPAAPVQPLTPAEVRVARAVADGLSNREVADELAISVKTVEFHLGNLFRKLGVRNRTELAGRLRNLPPVG